MADPFNLPTSHDADAIFSQLLEILASLDAGGFSEAAQHVNQALEILSPRDPRIPLLG